MQCISFSISGTCIVEVPAIVEGVPIHTPFQYHNQCSFELLKQYIPVSCIIRLLFLL